MALCGLQTRVDHVSNLWIKQWDLWELLDSSFCREMPGRPVSSGQHRGDTSGISVVPSPKECVAEFSSPASCNDFAVPLLKCSPLWIYSWTKTVSLRLNTAMALSDNRSVQGILVYDLDSPCGTRINAIEV